MNELIQRLIEKAGLPEAQAKLAAQIALGFVKEKLPAPLAAQLDGALGGDAGSGLAGGLMGGLAGMLGKKD